MTSHKPLILKMETCPHCHGSGIVEADGYSCPTCGGSGLLPPYAEDEPPDAAVREAVAFSVEARCNRLARGILRIGKKLRVMRADMAAQTDALIAAIHAINDAGILMPDEVLDYASGVRAAQAPRPDASCAAECLECDTRGGPWNVKPLTAERIAELHHSLSALSADGNVWLDEVTSPEELITLLSMLEKSYCVDGKNLHGHDCVEWEKRAWDAEARVQELLGEVEQLKAPPTDAAVREAVERLVRRCDLDERDGWSTFAVNIKDIRTILRAVQAPRLTGKQVEAVGNAEAALSMQLCLCADGFICTRCQGLYGLRAAFPEAFEGEVGRGE